MFPFRSSWVSRLDNFVCFVEYLFGINWTSLCTALPMLPRHDAELTSRVFNFYYSGRPIGDEKRLSYELQSFVLMQQQIRGSRLRNFSLPFLLLYQYLPPLDLIFSAQCGSCLTIHPLSNSSKTEMAHEFRNSHNSLQVLTAAAMWCQMEILQPNYYFCWGLLFTFSAPKYFFVCV